MAKYIYQESSWPHFTWDSQIISPLLSRVRHKQGLLYGGLQGLGFDTQTEINIEILTTEIAKSALIEGENLEVKEVRSSIARNLCIEYAGLIPSSRKVDGFVELIINATSNCQEKLDSNRLFAWHKSLFVEQEARPHAYGSPIRIENWRDDRQERMRVVSGGFGREKIHFEAPEAKQIEKEMECFFTWFNRDHEKTSQEPTLLDPVLKAGIAHLWFLTIHPFEDGNGRLCRALTDMLLARSDQSPMRFYSMSYAIEKKRNAYYDILEKIQKGDVDISSWLEWFLSCLEEALDSSSERIQKTLQKAEFWKSANKYSLNPRQKIILNKLLDDFEGKLTSSKYAKIAKCSQDTALHDLKQLMEYQLLRQSEEGGRSRNYVLV